MAIRHFDYVRPSTISEAVKALQDPARTARPLAGGTDLLVLVHKGAVDWDRLVDVSRLEEIRRIREADDGIIIGAAATHTQICEHPVILEQLPVLASACHSIGSPQIRNRGTLGGNVANAAACADTMPALVCLGATARFATPDGDGEMPVADLVTRPGQTSLPRAALIRDFHIPKPPMGMAQAYFKIGRRQAQSISRLSLAAMGRRDEAGTVAELRIVPGACTPQTRRFGRAEDAMLGSEPTEELVRLAGQLAAEEMVDITGRRWSTAYKEEALRALVERALRQLFGLAEVK